jgi:hypothetical protein
VIPLPSADGRFHLRPAGDDDLVTMLNEHLTDLGTPTMPNAVDRTYKSRAQGYHAWALLTDENRHRLSTNGHTMIPLTFDPAIWHRWEEPFTSTPVWYTYALEGPAFDLCDQEWGNGLALYALALWATVEDGWDDLAEHREALDWMWAWWTATDDWAWMRCANAFHGHGSGAGDCSCAAYAGAIGRARLMDGLGDDAARDEALCLAARTALSITARFGLTQWARERGLIGETDVAVGYHEGEGFLTGDVMRYPWTATSMISGNGVQPEVLDLLLARVPEAFAAYEEELLAANPTLFDGGADYGQQTLYHGNSGYITLIHLCAQARLGASDEDLRRWLASAEINSHLWWLAPTVLAEITARDADIWLSHWTRARWEGGWIDDDGTAHIAFENRRAPLRWTAHCNTEPSRMLINGHELGQWSWNRGDRTLTVETDLTGHLEFAVEMP